MLVTTYGLSKVFEMGKRPMRNLYQQIMGILYRGSDVYCPICENSFRRFLRYGYPHRENVQCPQCGSLERHRLLWQYVVKHTDLLHNHTQRMLHVAPEVCLEKRFKQHLGTGYLTADLVNPRAMVKMDVTNIGYPDQTFDIVYCSHVLEHVQQDRKALSEFYRVLKNSGWAIILVPITSQKTFEDASITSEIDRAKVFGQADHVRCYGLDYIDRLRDAGFFVEVFKIRDIVCDNEAKKMRLTDDSGEIYFCTKKIELGNT